MRALSTWETSKYVQMRATKAHNLGTLFKF